MSRLSIKERFLRLSKKHPYTSSLGCFNLAIQKEEYTRTILEKSFRELVDKEDWQGVPLSSMIQSLEEQTTP